MPRLLVLPLFASATLLLSGCGLVHFGRLPEAATPMRDAKSTEAFTSLATEHKILKQELALVRREGDTLRVALERAGSQSGSSDVARRLAETSAELATLRASYARLQAERSAGGATTTANASMREVEEKLATSLRDYTALQAENTRLRTDLDRARTENASLAQQLTLAAARYGQAQAEVSQLNTELLAQKPARTRSEQVSESLRGQLATIMAQAAATGTTPLQLAKAPPAGDSQPTAELRANAERIRQQAVERVNARNMRTHVVRSGDTLEKLSQHYLGSPERWRTLYEANASQLSNGQPLRVGMELVIPEQATLPAAR
ncbi:MAG: LysM peptidoglycan-binding domain-containing protein [Verrucomicrobiota bacterium]